MRRTSAQGSETVMKTVKAQFKFPGGLHPTYNKDATKSLPVEEMPLTGLYRLSTGEHIGAPAIPEVKKNDTVLRGQLIAKAGGFVSAAVHAPTSGKVKNVAPAATCTGRSAIAIEIEPDGEDTWLPTIAEQTDTRKKRFEDFQNDPDTHKRAIIDAVADAGIIGMGGAGFPTHVKLSPPPDKPIDMLVINGAECEPFLTSDHRLMVEHADHVWAGVDIIRKLLGANTVRIAIEDNKPDAITAIENAIASAEGDVAVAVLPTAYPQGAEKQQLYSVTQRVVPAGGLPMEAGAVIENVGTAAAIWNAVVNGKPLISRVTTVTGDSISQPKNVMGRIGTRYADMIEFCGGLNGAACKIIAGGPMMGFAQPSLETATFKTTSGILALPERVLRQYASMPCISCGRCVDACPMKLMPSELSQMLEAEDYEAADTYCVADCMECGCCAYACPAHRPLVQHMRQGKAWVMAKRRAEQAVK